MSRKLGKSLHVDYILLQSFNLIQFISLQNLKYGLTQVRIQTKPFLSGFQVSCLAFLRLRNSNWNGKLLFPLVSTRGAIVALAYTQYSPWRSLQSWINWIIRVNPLVFPGILPYFTVLSHYILIKVFSGIFPVSF